jgi:MoaA/NifB/PqqE/SkfB family radical SAM enzyme
MPLPPDIAAELEEAYKPFIESQGAIEAGHCRLASWRYFLEINSACNLRCPTCTKGSMEGYDHQTGLMDPELMEKILDKIASENPNAIVFTYGNSEPFLHPRLPECIAAIKRRGLHPEMSTNLNHLQRVAETLEAGPGLIIISLSGWTQEVYEKGHAGGKIDKVKANMRILAEANNARPLESRVKILVNYHVYNDNQHEIPLMNEYAVNLGLGFFTSYARAISMENAIQYCRHHDPEAANFSVQEGRPDWNQALPPLGETYRKAMARLVIPPAKAREMYQQWPMLKACPIGHMFSFIRHDGKISLCACVADRRIVLGNYLDLSQEERIVKRHDHAICQQCLKYRMSYYFHIVDQKAWTPPV